jgi:hypothetical protein
MVKLLKKKLVKSDVGFTDFDCSFLTDKGTGGQTSLCSLLDALARTTLEK